MRWRAYYGPNKWRNYSSWIRKHNDAIDGQDIRHILASIELYPNRFNKITKATLKSRDSFSSDLFELMRIISLAVTCHYPIVRAFRETDRNLKLSENGVVRRIGCSRLRP